MLLADVVATSNAVAATRARSSKVAAIAELLAELAPSEVAIVVAFLSGETRQGRVGVGWATLFRVDVASAAHPSVTVTDVDSALDQIVATTGSGSAGSRSAWRRPTCRSRTTPSC